MRPHSVDRFPRASSAPKRSLLSQSCDGTPHHGDRASNGQPRRPKTTPKPRVRRLLLGSGQARVSELSVHDDEFSLETESFMTQLPPSPPRMKANTTLDVQDDCDSDDITTVAMITEETQLLNTSSSRELTCEEEPAPANELTGFSVADTLLLTGKDEESSSLSQTEEESVNEQTDHHGDRLIRPGQPDEGKDAKPDMEENECADAEASATEANELSDGRPGPQVIDVDVCTDSSSDQSAKQREDDLESPEDAAADDTEKLSLDKLWLRSEQASHAGDIVVQDGQDDEEYRESLASRQQFQDEDIRRQVIRAELQGYVVSLTTRKDDSGDAFVTFPKNYDQVVSLMTEQDMRDEDLDPGSTNHKNWSRVLIQNALLKQNAYGVVDGGDEDADGLTAKIALKMARIRQLDAVLEEKLGKNLYSATATAAAGKKANNNPTESEVTSRSKTFVTQPQSAAKNFQQESSSGPQRDASRSVRRPGKPANAAAMAALKGKMNFVERNRQVAENGMRANLTRDEEARLRQLLGDVANEADNAEKVDSAAPSSSSESSQLGMLDVNVFSLDVGEKQAIEQLLSVKRDDDLSFLASPGDDANARELCEILAKKEAGNVIQANRLDRVQSQRLERIDQELRLLQQTTAIEIQADEDEDDEDTGSVMDDCQSEISYKTSVSMSSTCSTRSGVISRREFSRFVAAEVARNSHEECGAKASTGAIQGLLSSFTHFFARPEAAMAT